MRRIRIFFVGLNQNLIYGLVQYFKKGDTGKFLEVRGRRKEEGRQGTDHVRQGTEDGRQGAEP
jgi:hypothetical protein